MIVAVTGGAGWIGSRVVAELKSRGYGVILVDQAHGTDVTNRINLSAALSGVDHVIHLAGRLGTHELFENPRRAVEVNVVGTLNVLELCRLYGLGYTGITMPEVNPSLYAATKVSAVKMAEAYHEGFGIPVSHVCAYNAFGPGQPFGPGHPQKIMPTFATLAWQGEPLPVWGDGDLWVDMVHVNDVARMLVDAMGYGECEMFDAGTAIPMSVRTVANFVNRVTGNRAGITYLPPRVGERRERTRQDYSQKRGWDKLGWRPMLNVDMLEQVVHSYHPSAVAA